MSDTYASAGVPQRAPGARTDTILTIVIWVMVATLVGFTAYFGYTVWSTQQAEMLSTPALRTINELKGFVRRTPNDAALRVRLGEALGAAGLVDEAVKQLSVATKLDPTHSGAFLDLGLLAVDKEQFKPAEGYFQKVIEITEGTDYENINQRRETAFYYLGLLANHDKRYEDAIGFFKASLRIRKDASDTYYNMAKSYQALDRPESAIEQLTIALNFDPNYAQAHYQMGVLLKDLGQEINAVREFRKAAATAPGADLPAEALASFGTVAEAVARGGQALRSGDLKVAEHQALLAKAIEPESADALRFYAMVLEKKNDTAGALAVWQQVLKSNPEDQLAKEAVARLSANAK